MVEDDIEYLQACINAGLVQSPCLELGVGYEGPNNKERLRQAGIIYFGSDLRAGQSVDYVVDFESASEEVQKSVDYTQFGSVLVLNVLEHTFDPIKVLDNVFCILRSGGTCVVITPTVWPIHNYPIDCWRINPNFYEEYCHRRSLILCEEFFEYIGMHPIKKNMDLNGTYVLPSPAQNKLKNVRSRIIHKLFNTSGRGMFFPSHVATGVVMRKPSVSGSGHNV
jgi:SAM-dependent methyltransferase